MGKRSLACSLTLTLAAVDKPGRKKNVQAEVMQSVSAVSCVRIKSNVVCVCACALAPNETRNATNIIVDDSAMGERVPKFV